jgi:hypothetical protein
MVYFLKGKEVGYAEYVEYLESTILFVKKALDEIIVCDFTCICPKIDEAMEVINLNKKMKEEMLKA